MSNEKANNNINPFDPKTIVSNLSKTIIPMNTHGICFRDTCSTLESKIMDLFTETLHIPETDHVLVYPVIEERGGNVCEIKCFVYFDTSIPNATNIKRASNVVDGGEGRRTILDFAPGRSVNGEFIPNDTFKAVFTPLAMLDDEGKIIIRKMPKDKRVAVIELDFFLLMAMVLDIDDDDPYNFTVLAVDSTNNFRQGGGYEDVSILMMKYIDNRKRSGRNRGRGKKIDYRSMDRELMGGGRGKGRDY